jgi:hypothetical protein
LLKGINFRIYRVRGFEGEKEKRETKGICGIVVTPEKLVFQKFRCITVWCLGIFLVGYHVR